MQLINIQNKTLVRENIFALSRRCKQNSDMPLQVGGAKNTTQQ